MLAWLPYEDREEAERRLGGLPAGVDFEPFTDPDALGDSVGDVEFLVTPYMSGARSLARIVEMRSLRAVQTLTAGYEDVISLIPEGVALHNAAGVHDTATAELAIALMLASSRRSTTSPAA